MFMQAVKLASSIITHTRHGTPSHFLSRSGFSVLIDLDKLKTADVQSHLFSVDKFNLISFYQSDYGDDYLQKKRSEKHPKEPNELANYVRNLARQYLQNKQVENVFLLTFPRIFNLNFNPISVFICQDSEGKDCLIIYEVHNTFGDSHSYISVVEDENNNKKQMALKKMHVSPFFPTDGEYILYYKRRRDSFSLIVRYFRNNKPALTATMRGNLSPLTSFEIIKHLIANRQFPLRPLISIHFEALKLFLKQCIYYPRPSPPTTSISKSQIRKSNK